MVRSKLSEAANNSKGKEIYNGRYVYEQNKKMKEEKMKNKKGWFQTEDFKLKVGLETSKGFEYVD